LVGQVKNILSFWGVGGKGTGSGKEVIGGEKCRKKYFNWEKRGKFKRH